MSEPVYVSLEFTPNPNTLKYAVNRTLLTKRAAANYLKKDEKLAETQAPLASKLLKIDGIAGIMIGKDFVTITKSETGDWDHVHKEASSTLESHLKNNETVVVEDMLSASHGGSGDNSIENKIREILDEEIRPAVAMDGGDITFEKYEAGIVYLHMQGSCAGCPSSTATLKQGIETKLKEEIPEIIEVVAI